MFFLTKTHISFGDTPEFKMSLIFLVVSFRNGASSLLSFSLIALIVTYGFYVCYVVMSIGIDHEVVFEFVVICVSILSRWSFCVLVSDSI